ncbi:hypothetical protein CBR_g39232 [Chara braunii]|uniref:Pentacotripeptide-repeat region of PRORP domain-containing protein n=1 Tax=Chara braunii TaxID=69332 RepID=A0A388LR98_CHABU|nr:hypothetical protein CBR_g39232 [Chara braunii]|eukprot:GBG84856.1 hypothetical protein CBR_g39232 [Chara braunii]
MGASRCDSWASSLSDSRRVGRLMRTRAGSVEVEETIFTSQELLDANPSKEQTPPPDGGGAVMGEAEGVVLQLETGSESQEEDGIENQTAATAVEDPKTSRPRRRFFRQGKEGGKPGSGSTTAREKVSRQTIGNVLRILKNLQEGEDFEAALGEWKAAMTAKDVCLVIRDGRVPMEAMAKFVRYLTEAGKLTGNVYAHNIYLNRLVDAKRLEEAEKLVEGMIAGENEANPTAVTFTTLIDGLRKAKKFEEARKWYMKMKELNVPNTDVSRFVILRACGAGGWVDIAESLYEEMKASGEKISLRSFNVMVNLYGKAERAEAAERVVDEMIQRGVKPSEFTYNMLISLWRKAGDVERALAIFQRMKDAGVHPSDMTYNTVLSMYVRRGMFTDGEKLMNVLLGQGRVLAYPTYSLGINMFRWARKFDRAVDVWNHMLDNGCKPDMPAYGAILEAYAKMGAAEEAEKLWKELHDEGHKATRSAYRAMLIVYVRGGNAEKAKKLYEEMKEKGLEHDQIACLVMMGMYGQLRALDKAATFYEKLQAVGALRDHTVQHVLLDLVGKTDKRGLTSHVFRQLQAMGRPTEEAVYTLLIDVYGRASRQSDAQELFAALKQRAVDSNGACAPNLLTYASMITMFGRLRDIEGVERMWKDLSSSGLVPDQNAYRALIDAYGKSGMTDEAQKFSVEMEGKGMPRYETNFRGKSQFEDGEEENDEDDNNEAEEEGGNDWENDVQDP